MKYDTDEILFAIEKLPPMSKTVFNLYAVDGYKHEGDRDIARHIFRNLKKHISFKARKKLQEMLSDVKKTEWNKPIIQ